MEFVNPGFLYGLFAIAIPIIIHLFNFRRFKKVYFTNVSFIQELKQQTQKQSRLKHLLILLMRILAIVVIVLAFAQPYIPVSTTVINPKEKNAVSIYVDNSFSMQAESEKGTLLDAAKEKAKEIISVYKNSDEFQLVTNDFEGRHQRFVSKDEIIDLIDEINISPVVKTLPEIYKRQQTIFRDNQGPQNSSYIISDFQHGMIGGSFPLIDSTIGSFLIPLSALNKDNLYIDSCWFKSPVQQKNQVVELIVRIQNNSANEYEKIPVRLSINEKQRAVASFDIGAYATTEVILGYTNYESGIQYGKLEIDDYPISFDDQFYFNYLVSDVTSVLTINGNGENLFLNSLFGNDSTFVYENVKQGNIDFSNLGFNQLIILNELKNLSSGLEQELHQFVENGGSLIVIPHDQLDPINYRSLFGLLQIGNYTELDTVDTRIDYINLEHPLYTNVFDDLPDNIDLPVVFQYYKIKVNTRSAYQKILQLREGNPFLNIYNAGEGKVYLFAVPFQVSFSNFPKHAIFVPTLYKIAISSIISDDLYYIIGEQKVVPVRNLDLENDNVLVIKDQHSDFEFIPELRRINKRVDIYPHGQITSAGNYTLFYENKPLQGMAFNYDRIESEMNFYTVNELNEMITDIGLSNIQIIEISGIPFVQTLSDISQGKQLWRWFVIFALLFLLIEVLLLRFIK
jgi:hypothetical protein